MRALNEMWQVTGRDQDGEPDAKPDVAERLRRARQRVWVADTACYYAHQRYQQSGSVANREAWEARRRECDEAVEALRQAERLQARLPGR